MYSTCMFCNKSLGSNQVVESFPIGKRLAFDAEKGRLWIVCRRCERWNLTPIEERWEAVEDCERLFRGLPTRTSTEHVGIARHPGGVDLVRIGRPERPEFAAWRYGDQFGRRRKKNLMIGAGALVALGAVVVGGVATGLVSGALLGQSGNFVNMWNNGRTLVKFRAEDGKVIRLRRPDLVGVRMVPGGAGGWDVHLSDKKRRDPFTGDEATAVAGRILPALNASGAKPDAVQQAVRAIEDQGHPEAFYQETLRELTEDFERVKLESRYKRSKKVGPGALVALPHHAKLALEMALHEEGERRALQGELRLLELAWRDAEEIAAISDSLLLPEGADEFVAEHSSGGSEAG